MFVMDISKISTFMDEYLVAKHGDYERFGILSIGSVLNVIREIDSIHRTSNKLPLLSAFGKHVSIANSKIRTFVMHGQDCICCGIKGAFFAIEKNTKDFNSEGDGLILNLYAINDEGDEVLMNMDHRIPKYHGGANCVENMQTMCNPCNLKKGHKLIFTEGGVSLKEEKEKQKQQQNARSQRIQQIKSESKKCH